MREVVTRCSGRFLIQTGFGRLQRGGLHVVVARRPGRHGERGGRILLAHQLGAANQRSRLAAALDLVVPAPTAAAAATAADRLAQYGGGPAGAAAAALRAAAVPARERAVLLVQARVHVLARGARARLQEALLEVVAEERVQDGVHGAVAVAKAAGQQEYGDDDLRLALLGRREYQRHLRDPVRQPAQHVHRDHRQHQFGHLPMRLLLLLRLVHRSHLISRTHREHTRARRIIIIRVHG